MRLHFEHIHAYFQQTKQKKLLLVVIAWLFPFVLSFLGTYISFGTVTQLKQWILEQSGAVLLTVLLFLLCYGMVSFATNRFWIGALVTGFLGILLPLIDHFKFLILQDHFYPWDLTLAQNAGSFTEFLGSIQFPISFIVWILFVILYIVFLYITKPKLLQKKSSRYLSTAVCVVCLVVLIFAPPLKKLYPSIFGLPDVKEGTDTNWYETYGFFPSFLMNMDSVHTLQPNHYNKETMYNLFAEYIPEQTEIPENYVYPDIVVVLSEAFWDPTILNGVTFSEDPLPNYRNIAASQPSGQMVSCTFGGGTIRPEFEILSGMSTSALPSGNMPYQQYLHRNTFSYAQLFKSMGYDTLGIHTYQKTFYERDRAYPLMGIDEFLGENDLHAELHWNSGPYITDETIAEEIIYQLEQPHDTALYLTAITMENHSLYTDKYDESDWEITVFGDTLSEQEKISLQNYCTGIYHSDQALGQIYEYVMQRERPTVVLWYGDHLPTLGDNFSPYTSTGTISSTDSSQWTDEEKNIMFRTPYVMFTNYDTQQPYFAEGQAVSPYMLEALLCDYINAPDCLQTNFLLDVYRVSPYISKYYDLYAPGSNKEDIETITMLHQYLTYDLLIGEQYLNELQGFSF